MNVRRERKIALARASLEAGSPGDVGPCTTYRTLSCPGSSNVCSVVEVMLVVVVTVVNNSSSSSSGGSFNFKRSGVKYSLPLPYYDSHSSMVCSISSSSSSSGGGGCGGGGEDCMPPIP